VQRDVDKGLQLVPLHPCLQEPETGFRLGALRRPHECIARRDQALELGHLSARRGRLAAGGPHSGVGSGAQRRGPLHGRAG